MALARVSALMHSGRCPGPHTTSHGTPHGLNYEHSLHGAGVITPAQLAGMLAQHGFQNRLVILQACFSGQFIPTLAAPRTVVATAAFVDEPVVRLLAGQ